MKHQEIIDWTLEQLSQGKDTKLPKAMQDVVAQNPALQQQLGFIQAFWHAEPKNEKPSPHLRTGFYQQLAAAQQKPVEKPKLSRWLMPLWAQAAALVAVFGLGYIAAPSSKSGPELAALQQQVSELSTAVTLSLLQQPSASERLSAASYVSQANASDPRLQQALLQRLENDNSSAVRLAIIDSLPKNQLTLLEPRLLSLAVSENNLLVQLSLCRLLLNHGSALTREALLAQLSSQPINPDLAELLDSYRQASSI